MMTEFSIQTKRTAKLKDIECGSAFKIEGSDSILLMFKREIIGFKMTASCLSVSNGGCACTREVEGADTVVTPISKLRIEVAE